ncbi:ATP-dependent DNA helicase [Trichonephila clavata]|uniref:ATP-dependent DNA helicase n=1 Tax=Trichonephila clavata TaxID=2740835 RepID=A0A8X6KCG8_TRICU|nr:ATP-dependent DNA helicase [Trichonephila clavata]
MLEDVDNSWVVPYSPLICRIFKAHINVEYCNSVKSIKYVCKYVTKRSDTAMFAVANEMTNRLDEVTTYQQGRYISSSETARRLLDFPIHQRYPKLVHLATLLQKTLLYSEVPRHFRWDASQKVWQIRKKGVPLADFPEYVTDNALGRVYTVHPNDSSTGSFHRLLLLHHVRGPISFEDLKTVIVRDEDGDILEIKPCSTYTEACQVLGLLEDDSDWYEAMEEAAVSQSPAQLRNLFAILVALCGLKKPITLRENHKEDMTEDFLHEARRNNPTGNIEYCDALFNNTLLILEDKILSITGHKLALYSLPESVHDQPELISSKCLNIIGKFANKLLQIGDGKVPEDPSTGLIIMPCGQIVNSPDELLSKMYPNIQQNFKDQDWLSHRAILTSRNDVVKTLNVTIQKQHPGKEYAYKHMGR